MGGRNCKEGRENNCGAASGEFVSPKEFEQKQTSNNEVVIFMSKPRDKVSTVHAFTCSIRLSLVVQGVSFGNAVNFEL